MMTALGLFAVAPGVAAAAPRAGSSAVNVINTKTAITNSTQKTNGNVVLTICNNSSCTGSGTYIYYIDVLGQSNALTGCATAEYTYNGNTYSGEEQCWDNASGSEIIQSWWYSQTNFIKGLQVCGKFVGTNAPTGEPCAIIG
jgi:NADH:ubiquinone oxidoreductase subunit E